MPEDPDVELLAEDVYARWCDLVRKAEFDITIVSPYLDALVLHLLSERPGQGESFSVLTDLSPATGATDYRGQLLAVRALLDEDVEVRSLSRLHAKVLVVDDALCTVGSQNFTSYARGSRETTAIPTRSIEGTPFQQTIDAWWASAIEVDAELLDGMIANLDDALGDLEQARTNIEEQYNATWLAWQAEAARRRLEADARDVEQRPLADRIKSTARSSSFRSAQETAWGQLRWNEAGTFRTFLADPGNDLTAWTRIRTYGTSETISLHPKGFYPVLLAPSGRVGFARVAMSRISYVWRGLSMPEPIELAGRRVHLSADFPDDEADGANVVVSARWHPKSEDAYDLRLQFDGSQMLRLPASGPSGRFIGADQLAAVMDEAYEDEGTWVRLAREILVSVEHPRDFMKEPGAADFFPDGYHRVNLALAYEEPVLIIQRRE